MSNNEKYVCINCVEQIAEKDTEIERLTSALLHVEQLHSISEARKDAEIKRLRKLVRQCQPFFDRLQPPTLDLSVEIAKELGDE